MNDESNIWTLLYHTGYLTKSEKQNNTENTFLVIPNKEVKNIFINTIQEWFKGLVSDVLDDLLQAFWNADAKTVQNMLNVLLQKSISYHDSAENFYHGFVTGIFSLSPCKTTSNRESGNGRPDLVVEDRSAGRALIIELKHAEKPAALAREAQAAMQQINDLNYVQGPGFEYPTVLRCGIAFWMKQCAVSMAA